MAKMTRADREDLHKRRILSSSNSKEKLIQKIRAVKQLMEVYEDKIIDGDDWRSTYRLPELFGALERKKSDMMENLTEVTFKSTLTEEYDMAPAAKAVMEHFDLSSNYKAAKLDAIDSSVMYGTGIEKNDVTLIEGMQVEATDQLFLEYKDAEIRTKYFGLSPTTIDLRDAFPDPSAVKDHDMHGGKGMDWFYQRKIYTEERFDEIYGNNKLFDTSEVVPVSWGGVEQMGTDRWDTKHEMEEKDSVGSVIKYVVVFEGWDIINDWHVMVANSSEIYFGAIPYRHKQIPVVFRYNYKRDDSIWGISEAEILAPFVLIKEVLVNLMIDNAKLSQQPVIAVSGDLLFDPDENQLEPGALFTLRGLNGGKIGDAIQPLTFGSSVEPANAVKNILEDLQIQVTGDDSRALFVQPNELATQTLAKQESMKRRIRKNVLQNTVQAERTSMYQRFYNICQYMSVPYEDVEGNMKFHIIPIEDYHVVQRNSSHRPEFTTVQGNTGYFKLNERTLDPRYVYFDIEEKIEDTVKKEQELQSLQWWMQTVVNLAQINPELVQNTDFEMLAKQTGKRFTDIDVDAIFNSVSRIVDGMDEMSYHIQQIALGIPPTIAPDGNNMRRLEKYRLFSKTKEYALLSKESKKIFQDAFISIVKAIRTEKDQPFGAKNKQLGVGPTGPASQQGPAQGPPQASGGSVPPEAGAVSPQEGQAGPVPGGQA